MPSIPLIDPMNIDERLFPLFVSADNMRSLFGLLIKDHSHGKYSHSMIQTKPCVFASQGWTFKEEPVENYLSGKYRLKYWKPKITKEQKSLLFKLVEEEVRKPWYKTMYDVVGILGQAINIDAFNIPGLRYCSEANAQFLIKIGFDINPHPTPSELDELYQILGWDMIGYYFEG